jgi:hypothetical protein
LATVVAPLLTPSACSSLVDHSPSLIGEAIHSLKTVKKIILKLKANTPNTGIKIRPIIHLMLSPLKILNPLQEKKNSLKIKIGENAITSHNNTTL